MSGGIRENPRVVLGLFPLAAVGRDATMRIGRGPAAAMAAGALAAGIVGALLAMTLVPSAEVTTEDVGGVVVDVLPGGPAWSDSIRAGQLVTRLSAGDSPEAWILETSNRTRTYRTQTARAIMAVRSTFPVALVASLISLIAIVMVRSMRATAAALAATGLVVATVPFMAIGDAIGWTVVAVAVSIALAAWLVSPGRWRTGRFALGGILAGVAVLWAVARFTRPELFEPTEAARAASLIVGVGLGWVFSTDLGAAVTRASRAGFPSRLDVLAAVLIVAVAVVARLALGADWWVALSVAGLSGLLYARVRHGLAATADRVLMAETRERAAIGAIEAERARVAREIHDTPLQELSGVIRNLELVPNAARETTALRAIAQQLREVAIELHPPHLQDLGLGPVLEYLVAQANLDPTVPVELDLDDAIGAASRSRLPPNVELGLYRISQEAVGNAQRHSGASLIEVGASITTDHVTIEVRDDGGGITQSAVDEAQREGHFGLASMRQRAELIDADLRLETGPAGTTVTVEWRAR